MRAVRVTVLFVVGVVVSGCGVGTPAETALTLRQALPSASLVISQVFGAGGATGTGSTPAYRTDFVELHNVSGQPVALGPLTLQYASFMGLNWQVADFDAAASVPPGGYHLVAFTSGMTTIGPTLPTPDTSNPFVDLARAEFKLALVTGITPLTGTCPLTGPDASRIVDFVGSGTANCFEGAAAPPASVTTGLVRKGNGCLDTDRNADDFEAIAPVARNASTPAVSCFADGGSSGLPDAGSVVDAGVADGGVSVVDAGTRPDAGTMTDAGSTVDAGVRPDAGAPSGDAGSAFDGGAQAPDAGMTPVLNARTGCRCSSVDASSFLFALGVLVVARRRVR